MRYEIHEERDMVKIVNFRYLGGSDKNPRVLVLGSYRHSTTNNLLLCGINLNYLSEKDKKSLAEEIVLIMEDHTTQGRCQYGRQMLPSIFEDSFREYRQDKIRDVETEELHNFDEEVDYL